MGANRTDPGADRRHGSGPEVRHGNIVAALDLLTSLGFPRAQQNDRSALTLLALANVGPTAQFPDASDPLLGITPIMDWVREHYGIDYAPNTRETVRRQTIHQFRDAGLVHYNPDNPDRPVNSPKAVYQIAPAALALVRLINDPALQESLTTYRAAQPGLAARYARERDLHRIAVKLPSGFVLRFSPGAQHVDRRHHYRVCRTVRSEWSAALCRRHQQENGLHRSAEARGTWHQCR